MDKIIQPCPPIVGVGLGKTATLDLSIGPRYHAVWLEILATGDTGKTLALTDVLDLINIKINGRVQRAHLATELDQINTSYGPEFAANIYNFDGSDYTWSGGVRQGVQQAKKTKFFVPIFFAEPWRKSYAATEAMAWYTAWQNGSVLQSFQMELTVPNTGNVKAADPFTITAYAETDAAIGPLANNNPVALITRWDRLAVPYTAAGDLYVTNLQKRDVYTQISMFGQSGDNITDVKLKVDNRIIRDITRARNDQTLIARGFNEAGLPQDRFDLVFDYSDLPTDGLVLAGSQDVQLIMTLDGADASSKMITLIQQIYGGIN